MFIDKVTISVKAGNGGNGAVAFHREKFVAAGGPDGGDGGNGGNVIVKVNENATTLIDYRYKKKFTAGNGADGTGKRCTGKDGEDVVLYVPLGTLIRDKETGGIIKDMSDDKPFVIAKGGKGGWGNQHFATPTRQVPHFAKSGLTGESREVVFELKLIADVGLIGFPNVGKSTLLSVITKAHPKIANYHFTTLYPNLGVVYVDEGTSFVMADIPGIIEGASEGAGLGHDFLRHIDRCRLLVHLVDISGSEGRDPIEDFKAINSELKQYDELLASRPQIVVANKCDILENEQQLEDFKKFVEDQGYIFHKMSAATHDGIKELIKIMNNELQKLPPIHIYEPNYVELPPKVEDASTLTITHVDGIWSIEGKWLERLISNTNFTDYESKMHFDRMLRDCGLYDRLESMGINEGDTVSLYNLDFEYFR